MYSLRVQKYTTEFNLYPYKKKKSIQKYKNKNEHNYRTQ